jgi:uncharacterized protein
LHNELYIRGVELFNLAEFYDAHEVLEDVWRAENGPQKLFLQGLIQVAVALHHHSTGNVAGAKSLLRRARKNLSGYPDHYCGVVLIELRRSLADWQSALDGGTAIPPLPKLEFDENQLL